MWNKTRITELLGIKYPIVQGPFGGRFSSVKLSSTVSNLGGLGSFGLNAYDAEEILEVNKQMKVATNKPYVLNLWIPLEKDPVKQYSSKDFSALKHLFQPYFEQLGVPLPNYPHPKAPDFDLQIEAILQAKPPVASFIFGIPPKEIIQALKKVGSITAATATTLEEAFLIEEAGIDLVIASGAEAGGHRAAFHQAKNASILNLQSLLGQIKEKLKLPIIAAGGISNGRDVAKLLQLGADAAQLGTAFLATDESGASEIHKSRLFSDPPLKTSLTKVYTGRLARAISNTLSKDFEDVDPEKLAPYPIQSAFLSPLRKAAIAQKRFEYVAFWAGQPSRALKYKSTTELFNALVEEAANYTSIS